jgi:hypothetical protein
MTASSAASTRRRAIGAVTDRDRCPIPGRSNRPPASREPPRSSSAGAGSHAMTCSQSLFRKSGLKSATSDEKKSRCARFAVELVLRAGGSERPPNGSSMTIWGISTTLAHIVARRFLSSADAQQDRYGNRLPTPPHRHHCNVNPPPRGASRRYAHSAIPNPAAPVAALHDKALRGNRRLFSAPMT